MAKTPTVLIVDESDDGRVELRKLLQRAGLNVAGDARYGANAAATAHELRPDAVLVGVEEPPNRALETIEALSQLLLETPILAYSSIAEAGAIRRATRAGVRDYLLRPLEPATVRESIITAIEQEDARRSRRAGRVAPPPRGTVITVTGAKGGIGKSSVAINLALALRAATGQTVGLVDADTHFGDVAMMLNVASEPPVTQAIASLAALDRNSVLARTVPHASGLRVFPGPAEPDEWQRIRPEDVARFVGLLAESFDFVVIDTPDLFDSVVEECVVNATLVLLVTSLDLSSIANTRVALRTLHRWNVAPEKVRLTVNHIHRREGVKESQVEAALNWPVFWSVPYDQAVPEVAQMGESRVLTAPRTAFSASFYDLAGAISGSTTSNSSVHWFEGFGRIFRRRTPEAVAGLAG